MRREPSMGARPVANAPSRGRERAFAACRSARARRGRVHWRAFRGRRSTVKAVRVHACGGPEALRYEDVATPAPGRGEARVKIAASGVNFIDVQQRAGRYKPPAFPFTLGSEAAGTVTAVGPEVRDVS